MKAILFGTSLTALICLSAAQKPIPYEVLWDQFKKDYNKVYPQDANGKSERERFEIFKTNIDVINRTNARNLSYWLGVNEFADQTWEEFASAHLGFNVGNRVGSLPKQPFPNISDVAGSDVADSIDWVAKGAVTPVKNQMQCGSCWAFSTTGAVEGAMQIATGRLISLSEQDLVSCDKDGDLACKGGSMDTAFGWIKKHGICTEQDYPYTSGAGVAGTCITKCRPEVTLSGFRDIPKGDEASLLKAVNNGPVSVAIEADKSAFQLYQGGILDSDACGNKLDHGVLVVGYGSDSGREYWKVKNSWGVNWGEDGYIRMVRSKNMCGIANMASYPTGVTNMGPLPPTPAPTPPPPPPPPPGPKPSPSTGCKFHQVQDCYTASLQTCWTPFSGEKNKLTSAALAALSDQTVATGIGKILVGGSQWKDIWSVQTVGEYAYITAYTFQAIDFLQQYQYAQATLQLAGTKDPKSLDAFNKLTDQFDGVFYSKHGCGINNTASAVSFVV